MCSFCKDLHTALQIEFPSDLRKAITLAHDNIANGTLSDVTTGGFCQPFGELIAATTWDDILMYHFKCNHCGQRFQLSAETYHGRGGWWKPVE